MDKMLKVWLCGKAHWITPEQHKKISAEGVKEKQACSILGIPFEDGWQSEVEKSAAEMLKTIADLKARLDKVEAERE